MDDYSIHHSLRLSPGGRYIARQRRLPLQYRMRSAPAGSDGKIASPTLVLGAKTSKIAVDENIMAEADANYIAQFERSVGRWVSMLSTP